MKKIEKKNEMALVVVNPPALEAKDEKKMEDEDVKTYSASVQTDQSRVPELMDICTLQNELVLSLESPRNKQIVRNASYVKQVAAFFRSKCGPKPKRSEFVLTKDFKKAKTKYSEAHLKLANVLLSEIESRLKFQKECNEEMKRIEREAHRKIVELSNICINEFRVVQKQIRDVRADMQQLASANGVLHAFVDKNMYALEAAVKKNRKLASPWCKTDDAIEGLVQEGSSVKNARNVFDTVHQ